MKPQKVGKGHHKEIDYSTVCLRERWQKPSQPPTSGPHRLLHLMTTQKRKKQNTKYRTRLDACGCVRMRADASFSWELMRALTAAGISARSAHRPRLNGWLGQIDFRDEASWELCRRCRVGTGGFGGSCGRRSGLSLSILGDQSIQR